MPWLLLLWSTDSRAHWLSSCGTRALLLHSMWDLPGSGIEPTSPALAGGFFTTEPPGEPRSIVSSSSCVCSVTQLCLILCHPVDCSLPGSSVHGISQAKNTGVGCHFLLQGIFPTQGIKSTSSALASRFCNTEPLRKPIFFIVLVLSELLIHLFA